MSKISTGGESADVPACYRLNGPHQWHQRLRHRAVVQLLESVSGRVLDYGCGYGDITHAISQKHEVVGVDVDPARVAFAANEYAPIPFARCAPGAVPFADASFDVVVSVAVIHFVADPVKYLSEVNRVLRANGHLAVMCINQPIVRNAWRRILGRSPALPRLWVPPKSEFQTLLGEMGFRVIKQTWMYDPPFEGWRNAGDVFLGAMHQALSWFRVAATANYYLFLANKTG